MALDANGLSDPYVIIELVPGMHFLDSGSPAKTKVMSKTLNPVYEQTFELFVFPLWFSHILAIYSKVMDDAVPACAMLHFIVMDHDLIGRNDFAGEAFIRLDDVPGFAAESANSANGAALRQFNLLLMHPDQTGMFGTKFDGHNARRTHCRRAENADGGRRRAGIRATHRKRALHLMISIGIYPIVVLLLIVVLCRALSINPGCDSAHKLCNNIAQRLVILQ